MRSLPVAVGLVLEGVGRRTLSAVCNRGRSGPKRSDPFTVSMGSGSIGAVTVRRGPPSSEAVSAIEVDRRPDRRQESMRLFADSERKRLQHPLPLGSAADDCDI